ncbi:MAG: peptide chain release factor N(5)-glutamine methyltransferase [Pirellulales bacterium]
MNETEAWTIGRLLTWTTDFLRGHGVESPRLDAEVLLAAARRCARIELYTAFDEPASDELRTAFRELVRRRADGMPVAYLVGQREFYSLEFRVTPDVLIPRPETELLVVALLDRIRERDSDVPAALADVGTGSGVIAVCAAKHSPDCRVTAIDISPSALAVAKQNAERHGVADRVELVESDLFQTVDPARKFDLVVSNPPYVSRAEMGDLAREVRDHEPHVALEAGEHGLDVIERLVAEAPDRLQPGGWLMMEISPPQVDEVGKRITADGRLVLSETIKDLAGRPRVVLARKAN